MGTTGFTQFYYDVVQVKLPCPTLLQRNAKNSFSLKGAFSLYFLVLECKMSIMLQSEYRETYIFLNA